MELNEYQNRKMNTLSEISNGLVKKLDDCLDNNYCAGCKGCCCSNCPCGFSPKDFIDVNDLDYMKTLLNTGLLAISPLDFSNQTLYIRSRGIKDLDTIVTGLVCSNNSCLFSTYKGCMLDPYLRPSEGLLLLPNMVSYDMQLETCHQVYTDSLMKSDWYPYQKALKELKSYYKNREIEKPEITDKVLEDYTYKLIGSKRKKGAK